MKWALIAPVACLFASCASREEKTEAAPPSKVGIIRLVNAVEGFTLVESTSATAIEPGADYLAIEPGGARSAGLRATAFRRHPFQVVDIVDGSPSPGDSIQRVPESRGGMEENPPLP